MEEARQVPGAGIHFLVCHGATQCPGGHGTQDSLIPWEPQCKGAILEGKGYRLDSTIGLPLRHHLLSSSAVGEWRAGDTGEAKPCRELFSVFQRGHRDAGSSAGGLIWPVYPWKGGCKLSLCKWSPIFPATGGSFLRVPQRAETPALEPHCPPREPTFVHLSASTIYGYFNHLLLNVTQQSLSSETLQTALNCLEFSNLDVALSPSFSGSPHSLPAASEAMGGQG